MERDPGKSVAGRGSNVYAYGHPRSPGESLTRNATTVGGRFGGRKRVLFVGGALNQTKIAHAVARELDGELEAWFSPCYMDVGAVKWLHRMNLLEWTALGGVMRRSTLEYLRDHSLPIDDGGRLQPYDLVVATTDLVVPKNTRGTPTVLLQEGMTDPENLVYQAVKRLKLPRYLASTASFGLSHRYEYLCAASEGYKDLFVAKGVRPDRVVVTGLPNWDDLGAADGSSFPHSGYVLVATSDARETLKVDRRKKFLRHAVGIAAGRPMIFKLHPNENATRATREIHAVAPEALVFSSGDITPMIANCDALVTQYSTVVYTGMALGKEVHSYFDAGLLERLMPLQNGGRSAELMASVCRHVLRDTGRDRRELVHVCQCRDCRSGAVGLHSSAG